MKAVGSSLSTTTALNEQRLLSQAPSSNPKAGHNPVPLGRIQTLNPICPHSTLEIVSNWSLTGVPPQRLRKPKETQVEPRQGSLQEGQPQGMAPLTVEASLISWGAALKLQETRGPCDRPPNCRILDLQTPQPS